MTRTMTRSEYAALRKGYRDARRADRRREADEAAYRDGPARWYGLPRSQPGATYLSKLDAALARTFLRPYRRQDAVVAIGQRTRDLIKRNDYRLDYAARQRAINDAIAKAAAWSRARDAEMAALRAKAVAA